MTDLSHWDFALDFTPREAAALILGDCPNSVQKNNWQPVIERMRRCYESLKEWYESEVRKTKFGIKIISKDGHEEDEFFREMVFRLEVNRLNLSAELLESAQLHIARLDSLKRGDPAFIIALFLNTEKSKYFAQRFTRQELSRWLKAIGLTSIYQFDLDQSTEVAELAFHWPWGNHHTELLGHLEAAAQRYWVNYDPSDASTAPTNTTVSEWLQKDRKVSRTMADSIASMLRPDGLPTGPRK